MYYIKCITLLLLMLYILITRQVMKTTTQLTVKSQSIIVPVINQSTNPATMIMLYPGRKRGMETQDGSSGEEKPSRRRSRSTAIKISDANVENRYHRILKKWPILIVGMISALFTIAFVDIAIVVALFFPDVR